MSTGVATLGKEGVINDVDRKIDYLMCCFFFSKFSQSTLYRGRVTSLGKLLQMYGDNDLNIREEIETSLKAFLVKFFTTVNVTVTIEDNGDNPGIKLLLEAIVSDETSITPVSTSVGYSLLTKDSKLKSIIRQMDGATVYLSS